MTRIGWLTIIEEAKNDSRFIRLVQDGLTVASLELSSLGILVLSY